MAEKELNLELDNIKNGNFNKKTKTRTNLNEIEISKNINIVDKARGVYMVTVDAKKDDETIKLQGYERYAGVEEGLYLDD